MRALKWIVVASTSAVLMACSPAQEVTQCTTAPMAEWQDQTAFQTQLTEQGYGINEFKVTEGACYEIYGTDPDGNKVEIYFNPVDGSVVKREAH